MRRESLIETWEHLHLKGPLDQQDHNLIALPDTKVLKLKKLAQCIGIRSVTEVCSGCSENPEAVRPSVSLGLPGRLPGGLTVELCCEGAHCCTQRRGVECFWESIWERHEAQTAWQTRRVLIITRTSSAGLRMVGPGREGLKGHTQKLAFYPDAGGESLKSLVTWLNLHFLLSWGHCRVSL